jgi:Carboxypeptidase regulatory-like domain
MRIVATLSVAAFSIALAWGQSQNTAQIQGTILDASGAPVPGAQVAVTQTTTGVSRTASSGTDGTYVLPNLQIGPYRLEVSKEGFAKYVQTGIELQVATNPTIDVSLKLGAVSEQVQVEANAALVETQATGV